MPREGVASGRQTARFSQCFIVLIGGRGTASPTYLGFYSVKASQRQKRMPLGGPKGRLTCIYRLVVRQIPVFSRLGKTFCGMAGCGSVR